MSFVCSTEIHFLLFTKEKKMKLKKLNTIEDLNEKFEVFVDLQ